MCIYQILLLSFQRLLLFHSNVLHNTNSCFEIFPSLSTKYLSTSLREGAAESAKFDDMCLLYVLLLCKNGY